MENQIASIVVGTAGDDWMIYGPPVLGRACGSCKSCCTWVPVERPLNKPAYTRCRFLNHKGCSIYARRPDVCRHWSCRWLFDQTTAGMRRPDHAGYLIDAMLDTIIADEHEVQVAQIWLDPGKPDAHRDPALRAWLASKKLPAIVRGAGNEAMLIAPPALSDDGEWVERTSNMLTHEEMAQRRVEVRGG